MALGRSRQPTRDSTGSIWFGFDWCCAWPEERELDVEAGGPGTNGLRKGAAQARDSFLVCVPRVDPCLSPSGPQCPGHTLGLERAACPGASPAGLA